MMRIILKTTSLPIVITGISLLCIALWSCTSQNKTKINDDFKPFYEHYEVEGSFILYDQKNQKYVLYNEPQLNTAFTPASTFKILNSLISLETRVVESEHVIFNWDGRERQVPVWNADTDMKNAFKNSTVWFYQELARRIGQERMSLWLEKVNYGNADISGGIDLFWLTGGLRISSRQQIDFLRKLHHNELPFSERSMKIVKDIMIVKDTLGYVVRAKTGLGNQNNQSVGWYVGYITTKDNVYYFSNCIQTRNQRSDFASARINIVNQILDKLKILEH